VSWEHELAFRDCAEFQHDVRELLGHLCYRASHGKVTKGGKKKGLPFGWLSASVRRLQFDMNCPRKRSVEIWLAILVKAGVVQRKRTSKSSWTFVDLDWLKAHAYDPDTLRNAASPLRRRAPHRLSSNDASGVPSSDACDASSGATVTSPSENPVLPQEKAPGVVVMKQSFGITTQPSVASDGRKSKAPAYLMSDEPLDLDITENKV
jgi:hypothetical protein